LPRSSNAFQERMIAMYMQVGHVSAKCEVQSKI
jgi:hypothetical protein